MSGKAKYQGMRFKKRAEQVLAFQYFQNVERPEWLTDGKNEVEIDGRAVFVRGECVLPGEWIVRSAAGRLDVVAVDAFRLRFTEAGDLVPPLPGIRRVAYHTGDSWYLHEQDQNGEVVDEDGIEWPEDWPESVDTTFLRAQGFEIE